MKQKEKTCGKCRWWDQGTCDARQDEPTPAEAYPCPAFDDGSFDEAVRELVVGIYLFYLVPPDVLKSKIQTVKSLLKERER